MFTRGDIVNYSVKMGCNRDLLNKGMATTPFGDVFCIATLSGDYRDPIYYANGITSPKDAYYYGVYGINAPTRLYPGHHETKKNVAVTKTDGKNKFVYFFEKTGDYSKEYFFHGRYKYIEYTFIQSNNPEHLDKEILFHLFFIDRPILK